MTKYLNLVKGVLSKFESYTIARVERTENAWADTLAKMTFCLNGKNNIPIEYLERSRIHNSK